MGKGLRRAVVAVLSAVAAWAQPRGMADFPGRIFLGQFGEGWFAEAYALPQGDSLWAGVLLRLPYSTLLFERDGDRFRAVVHVNVEFVDSIGVVRRRLEYRDTVWTANYELTQSRDSTLLRALHGRVPWGTVRARLRLLLQQQELRAQELELSNARGQPQWSSPLVAAPLQEQIRPFVLGGALPFGATAARILLWSPRLRVHERWNYRCIQLRLPEERFWDSVEELSGQLRRLDPMRLEVESGAEGIVLRPVPDTLEGWAECWLPAAMLVPGVYELQLFSEGAGSDTLRWRFRVRWHDMPVSLRRFGYAVRVMQYLLTDQEQEALQRTPEAERWQRLWRYWKRRDPTPQTAYNEAMAVYFRRVDYAYFAFQSVNEPDGALTDRGKVYILYGPPTRTERELPVASAPREVWTYDRLQRRFVFELAADGRWRLQAVENLSQ
jgi:GWxTD domain-containing protein